MKGFSLIESIVVVAIIAVLAVGAVNTIHRFQQQSILVAGTEELRSTLRLAQVNSISGLLSDGEEPDDFSDTGLPYFGVTLLGSNYQMIREYTPKSTGIMTTETVESFTLDSQLSAVPNSFTIMFERNSGLPDTPVSITVTCPATGNGRTIVIQNDGLIRL